MHNIIMSVAVSVHKESNLGHLQIWSSPIAQNSTQLQPQARTTLNLELKKCK